MLIPTPQYPTPQRHRQSHRNIACPCDAWCNTPLAGQNVSRRPAPGWRTRRGVAPKSVGSPCVPGFTCPSHRSCRSLFRTGPSRTSTATERFVYHAPDGIEPRTVQVGDRNAERVEILSGRRAGERGDVRCIGVQPVSRMTATGAFRRHTCHPRKSDSFRSCRA